MNKIIAILFCRNLIYFREDSDLETDSYKKQDFNRTLSVDKDGKLDAFDFEENVVDRYLANYEDYELVLIAHPDVLEQTLLDIKKILDERNFKTIYHRYEINHIYACTATYLRQNNLIQNVNFLLFIEVENESLKIHFLEYEKNFQCYATTQSFPLESLLNDKYRACFELLYTAYDKKAKVTLNKAEKETKFKYFKDRGKLDKWIEKLEKGGNPYDDISIISGTTIKVQILLSDYHKEQLNPLFRSTAKFNESLSSFLKLHFKKSVEVSYILLCPVKNQYLKSRIENFAKKKNIPIYNLDNLNYVVDFGLKGAIKLDKSPPPPVLSIISVKSTPEGKLIITLEAKTQEPYQILLLGNDFRKELHSDQQDQNLQVTTQGKTIAISGFKSKDRIDKIEVSDGIGQTTNYTGDFQFDGFHHTGSNPKHANKNIIIAIIVMLVMGYLISLNLKSPSPPSSKEIIWWNSLSKEWKLVLRNNLIKKFGIMSGETLDLNEIRKIQSLDTIYANHSEVKKLSILKPDKNFKNLVLLNLRFCKMLDKEDFVKALSGYTSSTYTIYLEYTNLQETNYQDKFLDSLKSKSPYNIKYGQN